MSSKRKKPVDAKKALKAILDPIKKVKSFTSGYTKKKFEADEKTISAVCYQFVTIGERIYDLLKEGYFNRSPHSDVPWDSISQMRHFLAHEYYENIDSEILWNTVENRIPELRKAIEWHLKNEK